MGSISSIEDVQKLYLTQFLKGQYTLVKNSAASTQQKTRYQILFDEPQEYNLIEEVDKSIVCQWLKDRQDYRFENFINYYFLPNNTVPLISFSYENIFLLISPHNKINA
jgi:hypothetical protein